ncbi:hypothetical protein [Streptomyces sp. ME19-01-6]|uniref:hypothetical protein n=1 Tax=Streptomyces sp. ME19-01-6 TaxID=3028686 RepID=UPI0029A3A2B5|nr:hypothetical protein [Streptomyces sp. ME19-01-6]MDX3227307.1 hypothetical protein [Streptomyces sp. ME19-01-6]
MDFKRFDGFDADGQGFLATRSGEDRPEVSERPSCAVAVVCLSEPGDRTPEDPDGLIRPAVFINNFTEGADCCSVLIDSVTESTLPYRRSEIVEGHSFAVPVAGFDADLDVLPENAHGFVLLAQFVQCAPEIGERRTFASTRRRAGAQPVRVLQDFNGSGLVDDQRFVHAPGPFKTGLGASSGVTHSGG